MRHRAINKITQGVCVALLLCLSRTTHHNGALPQQVYIWQKKWPVSLQTSIEQTTPYVTGWRFLAGEYEPDGTTLYPKIFTQYLENTHHPITAVFRFDRVRPLPTAQEILTLVQNSPAYKQNITHIELDLDWPTAKLPAYIRLLQTLHQQLPASIHLDITLIPDWLRSPVFPKLIDQIHDPVLQLHSVDNPSFGLFNKQNALRYIHQMSRLTDRDFYIALPTYGMKVGIQSNGKIYFVEGESNLTMGRAGKELYSDPEMLRDLITQLETNTPAHLKGIIWFRLPTAGDQRNWSLQTWLAVIGHKTFVRDLHLEEHSTEHSPALLQLYLVNKGTIPIALPQTIPLKCSTADGFPPYHLAINTKGGYELRLTQEAAPLPAQAKRLVGWMRCEGGAIGLVTS